MVSLTRSRCSARGRGPARRRGRAATSKASSATCRSGSTSSTMQPIASSAPRAGSARRSPRAPPAGRRGRGSTPRACRRVGLRRRARGVRQVVGQRERRARVGPGDRAQQSAASAHAARDRAEHGHRAPRVADGRSGTRPGEGRRPTTLQNDAGLRMLAARSDPSASGDEPAGDGCRRAAAGAARRAREVVGVARRAEDGVEGLRAGAELRRVRLAEDDRAGARAAARRRARPRSGRGRGRSASRTSCACPAVSTRSLTAIGSPWSGPSVVVARERPRRPPRPARAPLGVERDDRVDRGSSASIRSRWCSITSTPLSSRARMEAASSVALLRQSSSLIARHLRAWRPATWNRLALREPRVPDPRAARGAGGRRAGALGGPRQRALLAILLVTRTRSCRSSG